MRGHIEKAVEARNGRLLVNHVTAGYISLSEAMERNDFICFKLVVPDTNVIGYSRSHMQAWFNRGVMKFEFGILGQADLRSGNFIEAEVKAVIFGT